MLAYLTSALIFVSAAAAITLNVPTNPTSGGTVTISWTASSSDPVFSLELINAAFNSQFAIQNNVDPSLGSVTLTLPVVPAGDGYSLEAVNITNINDVYSQTGGFSIGPEVSSSQSSTSSSTATSSASGSKVTTPAVTTTGTTSGFGTTLTSPASPASVTGSGTSTSTSSQASTSKFNGAVPVQFGGSGSLVVAMLGVVAGAAVAAL